MNLRSPLIALVMAVFGLVTVAEAADQFSYSGTTEGRPTFNRPTIQGPPFSVSGKRVRFHARLFRVPERTICSIDSSQNGLFDGVVHVYRGSFNPQDPLFGVIAGNNDFFSDNFGYSRMESMTLEANTTYVIVTSALEPLVFVDDFDRFHVPSGSFQNTVSCDSAPVFFELQSSETAEAFDAERTIDSTGACSIVGDPSQCLDDPGSQQPFLNRFRVSVQFRFQNDPVQRTALPVPGATSNSVLFYFTDRDRWELMVKVINFCNETPPIYKVLVGGTTNAEVVVSVQDTLVGGAPTIIRNEAGLFFDFQDKIIATSQPCP